MGYLTFLIEQVHQHGCRVTRQAIRRSASPL
jgi:hypothetical protein